MTSELKKEGVAYRYEQQRIYTGRDERSQSRE